MAPSPKSFPFLLLLALFFSLQIHARESKFFSKVSSNNNNNVKETELPNNEETLNNQFQEQEPNFIPETTQTTGYGLYGHESGQFSPTTTTTTTTNGGATDSYRPYKTEYYNNNNNAYETSSSQQQNLGGERLSGYTTTATDQTNNYNNKYYNNNGGNKYNVERQGMSDTRFMENGKYSYNLNNNKDSYYPNGYESSRNYDQYNNKGYYENNNQNAYENTNGVYQNQEVYQEGQYP